MTATIRLDDAVLRQLIRDSGQRVRRRVIHDGVEYGILQELSDAPGGNPRKSGNGTTGRGHPSLVPAFEKHTRNLGHVVGQAIERSVSLDDVIGKVAFDIQADWAGDVNVDTGSYKNSIQVDTE